RGSHAGVPRDGSPNASSAQGLAVYRQPAAEVARSLEVDPREGLNSSAAATRLERHGRNELASERPQPTWRRFLAQFQDVLVLLLLLAPAISAGLWLYERDSPLPYEALAILAVVLLNAVLGFAQEVRAASAVAALRQMAAAHAHVVRDGERQEIPA